MARGLSVKGEVQLRCCGYVLKGTPKGKAAGVVIKWPPM